MSIQHPIPYNNQTALNEALLALSASDALVKVSDVARLSLRLAKAARGEAFILQAGDCAERFSEATSEITAKKQTHLFDLAATLSQHISQPIVTVGRIAGQYAKPRSCILEQNGAQSHYAYHGDMINAEHGVEHRAADPKRLLQAYHAAKTVLGGLSQDVFTSHESLSLYYEQALTRETSAGLYNLSMHFPWLGMRNFLSEPHITYLSSIQNPIAIKVGPSADVDDIIRVVSRLNPEKVPGRISLILRLGVSCIDATLPKLIKAVQESGHLVTWLSDPLHGNTRVDGWGKKYRLYNEVLLEVMHVKRLLLAQGAVLGGLHLEISYRSDIRECVTDVSELVKDRVYDSALDPRLNYEQSMQLVRDVFAPHSQ